MTQNQSYFFAGWEFCVVLALLHGSTACYAIYNGLLTSKVWVSLVGVLALLAVFPFAKVVYQHWFRR